MNRFPGAMDQDVPDAPGSLLVRGTVQEHPDKVRRAHPLTHASADDPPFLIMHGDRDPWCRSTRANCLPMR